MKLLLHIGTEKTGSSFLQKACATNRRFLTNSGVDFPNAGLDEQRLLTESISPGNARALKELVEGRHWEQVSNWLATRVAAARSSGCSRLLLSNENLLVALSGREQLCNFETAARSSGIREISILLVIRNPVDQAVSLFKHRSKNGRAGEIKQWIRTGYDLPIHLGAFLAQADGLHTDLHIRKYLRQTDALLTVFFEDWLALEAPPEVREKRVNESLSLSEIHVLRAVALSAPHLVSNVHRKLSAIPREMKARDTHLENLARHSVATFLSTFDELWIDLSDRLAKDGGLELPKDNIDGVVAEDHISLSKQQINTIIECLLSGNRLMPRIAQWFKRVARLVKSKIGI